MEVLEIKGFEVKIGYDESCWMYDELWDGVHFLSNHRDYDNECSLDLTIEDIIEGNIPEGYEAVAINSYIHGGIALSLGEFDCPWDSGVFGFLVFKTGEFGEDKQGLEGFVNGWQAILNGHIYYYSIIDSDGEIIESCGGFTNMDYLEEEVNHIIDQEIENRKVKRTNRIKTMIKNRVPLEKRMAV